MKAKVKYNEATIRVNDDNHETIEDFVQWFNQQPDGLVCLPLENGSKKWIYKGQGAIEVEPHKSNSASVQIL